MTFSRRGHTNERGGGGGDDSGSVHNSTVTVDPHIHRERELESGFFLPLLVLPHISLFFVPSFATVL